MPLFLEHECLCAFFFCPTSRFHFFFQQSTFTSWVSNADLLRTEEIFLLMEHSCEMTLSDDMWQKKNVFWFDLRCMVVDALNLGRFYSSAATALAVIELPLLLQRFLLSIRFDTTVWGFIQAACGSPLPSFLRGGLDRRLHFPAVANLIPWWRFSISITLKNVSSSPPSTYCTTSCNSVLYVTWTVFPLQFAKYDRILNCPKYPNPNVSTKSSLWNMEEHSKLEVLQWGVGSIHRFSVHNFKVNTYLYPSG